MGQHAQTAGAMTGKHAAPIFPNMRRRAGFDGHATQRARPTDTAVILEWDQYYDDLGANSPVKAEAPHQASAKPAQKAEAAPIAVLQIADKGRTMRATSALLYVMTTLVIITPDSFGLSARTYEPAPMPVVAAAPVQVQTDTLRSRLRAYTDAEVVAFQQSVRGMSDMVLGQVIEDAWSKALIPGHMLADFFHDMAILAEAERSRRMGRF